MSYLLGIDLGSSNIKAAVFDIKGQMLARYAVPNRIHSRRTGWMEYDIDEIWAGVVQCIAACVKVIGSPEQIRGLSITSMGEAGVPISADGAVLYPPISWMDSRAEAQVKWWEANFDTELLYEITGMPLDPMYSINKILWLEENRPDVFQAMDRWLCLPDYILFKLTGEVATDFTIASRTMAFDVRRKAWSEEVCTAAGISSTVFPEAHQSGTVGGTVSLSAAEATGLVAGTPVVLGGHDHACVAWISGLDSEAEIIDSTGTGEAIIAVTAATELPPMAAATGRYAFYPHCRPDRMLVLQHMGVVGGLLSWIGSVTGKTPEEAIAKDDLPLYISHFRRDGTSKVLQELGAWLEVGLQHDGLDLFSSVVEGLCMWFRESLELHENCFQQTVDRILLTGGLARYREITAIKANVINRPIEVTSLPDLTLMGAAGIAGVGTGLFASWEEPSSWLRASTTTYVPNTDWVVKYGKRYEAYCRAITLK